MELMELPLELLHVILVHAAFNRGVKRALRLRLVCKTFAKAVHPALFETHLLDSRGHDRIGLFYWQLWHQHGADEVWHRYLVYRVMGERDANIGRYVEMRQIAQAVCLEMGTVSDLRTTVETLCWLTLKHGSKSGNWSLTGKVKGFHGQIIGSEHKPNLGLNLLSAAAQFDMLPLAKGLLDEGNSPTSHNGLFAPPIQVAAQAGNVAMLQLFQSKLPKTGFERDAITGAAIRGDLEILKMALQLPASEPSDEIPDDDFGRLDLVDVGAENDEVILAARSYATNPEVYDYLTKALAPGPVSMKDMYNDLRFFAQLGKFSMVEHLLKLGVPVQECWEFETPLELACKGLHDDVVDLLLGRGANPNFMSKAGRGSCPFHDSAIAGIKSLVQKLLNWGARPNRYLGGFPGAMPALWWAFAKESEDTIELLLENGASFDYCFGTDARHLVEMTYFLGYDSMTTIVREYGFGFIGPILLPRVDRTAGWRRWEDAKLCVPDDRW